MTTKNKTLVLGSPDRNFRFRLKSGASLEFKYVSVGDWGNLLKLANDKGLSDKDFVMGFLNNQLINEPKMPKNINQEELLEITKQFAKKYPYDFRDFEEKGDIYKNFRKSFIKANIEFAKDISGMVKQYMAPISVINASLRPMFNNLFSVQRIIESLVPKVNIFQNWIDTHSRLFEGIGKVIQELNEQFKINEKKAAAVLKKYKLFISPNMPATFIFEIVKIDQNNTHPKNIIENLFVQYFSRNNWKNMEAIVSRWRTSKLLGKRYKILCDCLETLKAENRKTNPCNVILPTLICQIDGALNDFLSLNKIQPQRLKYREKKDSFDQLTADDFSDMNEVAKYVFLEILLQRSNQGEPLINPFNFNRHKILHGENLRYGRADYVIRAFLVLDFLSDLKTTED